MLDLSQYVAKLHVVGKLKEVFTFALTSGNHVNCLLLELGNILFLASFLYLYGHSSIACGKRLICL